MDNPLISIIIPHFNRPLMLSNLLNTIPNNPYIEVLVIDDHSTKSLDAFQSCKQNYCKKNIRFYESPANKKGAGAARNFGIKLAKGTYLLFADSDDWFLPGWVEFVFNTLDSNADIIFFPPTSQTIDGNISTRHLDFAKLVNSYLQNPSHQGEICLKYLYCSPCSKLFKTNFILQNQICFDEVPYSEDMMFSGQTGRFAKKIFVSDKTIYCILDHSKCNTAIQTKYAIKFRQKMNNKYYFFLLKNVNREDRKNIFFPYKNNFQWLANIISVLLFEILYGHINIKSRTIKTT